MPVVVAAIHHSVAFVDLPVSVRGEHVEGLGPADVQVSRGITARGDGTCRTDRSLLAASSERVAEARLGGSTSTKYAESGPSSPTALPKALVASTRYIAKPFLMRAETRLNPGNDRQTATIRRAHADHPRPLPRASRGFTADCATGRE